MAAVAGGLSARVGTRHRSHEHGGAVEMVEINEHNAVEVAQRVKAGEVPGPAKSLAEAVCRVMQAVSYVRKDKQMQGGGSYQYVSVEAVIDKLRPEMIRNGLVLLPVGVEVLHQGDHGRQVHLRLKYTFDLVHYPSDQTRQVVVVGEGMDVGDKAGNKSMTAARKYALIMAFNIETGLDPDDTPSSTQERAAPQPQQDDTPIDDTQLRTLQKLVTETDTDIDKFLAWASEGAGRKVTSLKDLPARGFKKAKSLLESKKAGAK